jgi:hypothetical protein
MGSNPILSASLRGFAATAGKLIPYESREGCPS